jgi:hypothetical protein
MTRQGYPPLGQVATATIASAASTSGSIDLAQAGWSRLAVTYATMSTGAVLRVQGSNDNSTFKNVHTLVPTSSAVQFQQLSIATSVSGTGYAVFEAPPFRYVRFVGDAVVNDGAVISVYGAD